MIQIEFTDSQLRDILSLVVYAKNKYGGESYQIIANQIIEKLKMIENINDLLATVRLQNESKRIIDSLRGVKAENEDQDAKNLRDLFFHQRLFDELQNKIDEYKKSKPKTIQIEFTEDKLRSLIMHFKDFINQQGCDGAHPDELATKIEFLKQFEDALNESKQS
jgi:hypothetical protein